MTQADIEVRASARKTIADAFEARGLKSAARGIDNGSIDVSVLAMLDAMLAFRAEGRAEARREAFAEAAEVARTCTLIDSGLGSRRDGMQSARDQVATAIAEQGRLG